MKRYLYLFLAGLALIGCSKPAKPQNAGPVTVTLKIAHNMDFVSIPNSVIAAADSLMARYRSEGKDITIQFETDYQRIDWTEYHNNILFADKIGEGPDIFSLSDDIYGLLEAGMLLDISDVVSPAFMDNIFAPFTINGKAYGMPFDLPLRVLYYNKAGLAHIGWTQGEIEALPGKIAAGEFTFDQFMALAAEVQKKGGAQYGLTHRPGAGHDFFEILRVLGGEYYDQNNKLVFDEPALTRFFQFTYDNANVSKITPPNLNQMGWDTINKMVGNGDSFAYYGPLYSSTYVAGSVNKTPEQLVEDVSFILFPVSRYNSKPFTVAAPQGMGINAKTKYPDICKDLFRELAGNSYEQLAEHASKIFTLSSVKTANDTAVIKANPILKEVTYMADYAIPLPTVRGINTYTTEMHKQIVLLELGQVSPAKAVADFKTQIQLNLDADSVVYK
ncbi:sugar ABC transporter substrate-binding protein [Spirochaetia bacterium]|nr:sugar ABC transporter substrate-binding protein [Spirochaetia bacterium]